MHRLVYISTSRVPLTETQMNALLEVSRQNNDRDGITGLLVAGGDRFLQALEGPTAKVVGAFERIRRDPCHYACVVLTSQSVEGRAFGDWSMAFARSTAPAAKASVLRAVFDLTSELGDEGLKAEFRGFAELHARAA